MTYYKQRRLALVWLNEHLDLAKRRKLNISINNLMIELSLKHEIGERPVLDFIKRYCLKEEIDIVDDVILFKKTK